MSETSESDPPAPAPSAGQAENPAEAPPAKLHSVKAPPAPEGEKAPAAGGEKPPAPAATSARTVAPKPPTADAARHGGAGHASRLAKGAEAGQDPLVGSADLGWWVLNATMTVGLIALSAIVLYSCARMVATLFSIL